MEHRRGRERDESDVEAEDQSADGHAASASSVHDLIEVEAAAGARPRRGYPARRAGSCDLRLVARRCRAPCAPEHQR